MKKPLFYLLTVVMMLWIQMGIDYFLGTSGFSANAILVVVIYFGLSRGPMAGEMLGLLWGLLMDASSLGLMGVHAILFAGAGYFSGMLRRQLDERKVWTQTIFTTGVSVAYGVLYFILDRLFSGGPHPMTWSMLAQPLINGAVAPIFFWIMISWGRMWGLVAEER